MNKRFIGLFHNNVRYLTVSAEGIRGTVVGTCKVFHKENTCSGPPRDILRLRSNVQIPCDDFVPFYRVPTQVLQSLITPYKVLFLLKNDISELTNKTPA